ncbi:MAG: hypothetical protein M1825_000887 [Sarcosagium campestre]|nr:MAG: hypothetical protein M1825_000887 [Sarcosagium campestre]
MLSTKYIGAVLCLSSLVHGIALPDPLPLPLIIWHGLGDSYDSEGIENVASLAESTFPGTYTYTIRLSNDTSSDRSASFFGNLTEQLSSVCETLRTHPVISAAPAVNAIGFSQGGQFLRAYVERCNVPPVATLVTFGAQHNGISRFQACKPADWLCHASSSLLRGNVWGALAQSRLVPAQYYRDPEALEDYLASSNFLADVNNERTQKNATYAVNIRQLRKFVMFLFADDETVIPKESGWFAEVNDTTGDITPLWQRDLYTQDWLGLRALAEKDGLEYRAVEGKHMQLSEDLLVGVFEKYFSPADTRQLPQEQLEL